MNNIMIVGLGPHAKRIYLNYLLNNNITPKAIVDLNSQKEKIESYLNMKKISNIDLLFVSDNEKYNKYLSEETKELLLNYINKNNITHAIISTEPQAHFAYAHFFISNNINVLMDKPITSPINVINSSVQCEKIKIEYNQLCNLYKMQKTKNPDLVFSVQCQRRFQKGYIFVKNLLDKFIEKYNIPISYIDIYHNDGMWNMPNEFITRENHSYKYGYGKLFHSGYHFIDLLTWLLESNKKLKNKFINKCSVYSESYKPSDFFYNFNNDDYKKLFKSNKFKDFDFNSIEFANYGEIDIHSIINFYNNNKLITNCSLNLMQSGVSRRSWIELPEDTYKSNGRIRHERLNICVGPLLNIQIHSYQAYEIKDRKTNGTTNVGDLEHFDIYIFRNSDLIGGKPFEKLTIKDLENEISENNEFIGYNENARQVCLINFLNNIPNDSSILYHKQSIEITHQLYKSLIANGKKLIFDYNLNRDMPNETIAKIDDSTFGEENSINNDPPKVRFGSRGIILNEEGKIALLYKENKNEYKLPGGGIENNESPEKAFIRECQEEIGVNVEIEKCLGTAEEHKTKENFKQISFVFFARKINDLPQTNLTQQEIDEGSKIVWANKVDALEKLQDSLLNLKASKYDSEYRTKFMIKRDIEILKYYLNNIQWYWKDRLIVYLFFISQLKSILR